MNKWELIESIDEIRRGKKECRKLVLNNNSLLIIQAYLYLWNELMNKWEWIVDAFKGKLFVLQSDCWKGWDTYV